MDVFDITGPWNRHMTNKPFSFEDLKEKGKSDIYPVPDKTHAIQQLLALLHTRPDVGFLRTDPPFLLRFLRAKKFRVGDAFLILCRYFEYRRDHRELFRGLNSVSPNGTGTENPIHMALMDGLPGVLPERDPCGRPVIVLLASNWDHARYDVRVVYQAVLLTLECLIEEEAVQAAGVVVILDWSNFPARLTTTLSPKVLRLMLDGLQDAFPLRLGALHHVNQPWYVEAAISLTKPFLKEKLRSRIFVHGNNMATLHAQVPPRLLPAELGGEGGEYHAHPWAQTVQNYTPSRPPSLEECTIESVTNIKPTVRKDSVITSYSTSPTDSTNSSTSNKTSNKPTNTVTSPCHVKEPPPIDDNLINGTPPVKSVPWSENNATSNISQNTPLVNKPPTENNVTQNGFTAKLFGRKDSASKSISEPMVDGEELSLKTH